MSISKRFREIHRDVQTLLDGLDGSVMATEQAVRAVSKGFDCLGEWVEQVGDIPRISLEYKLTPVLLKAHNHLDRGRLLFEEQGLESEAAALWSLQQKIYRLLNDL
ncbi:MAG: hypothetical protein RQ723_10345 [Desulfuromonadales bacterium]|nr:hypothetical protein [Desulfuromonadales bacterium]